MVSLKVCGLVLRVGLGMGLGGEFRSKKLRLYEREKESVGVLGFSEDVVCFCDSVKIFSASCLK